MLVLPDHFDLPEVIELVPTSTLKPSTNPTTLPPFIPELPEVEAAAAALAPVIWAATLIFFTGTAALVGVGSKRALSRRVVFTNATLVSLIATLGYLAISIHQGSTLVERIRLDDHGHPLLSVFRQVFWAHNVVWTLTMPILSANIAFASGLPGAHLATLMFSTFLYGLTRLFASLSAFESARWIWYGVSILAFISAIYVIGLHGRTAVASKGAKAVQVYDAIALGLLVLATADTVIWSVSTGSRQISVGVELVSYIAVDILAMIVENGAVVCAVSQLPEMAAQLRGFWTEGSEIAPGGQISLPDPESVV